MAAQPPTTVDLKAVSPADSGGGGGRRRSTASGNDGDASTPALPPASSPRALAAALAAVTAERDQLARDVEALCLQTGGGGGGGSGSGARRAPLPQDRRGAPTSTSLLSGFGEHFAGLRMIAVHDVRIIYSLLRNQVTVSLPSVS